MRQSGFADMAELMSPRTAKYVEAMVREDFDYDKWLQRVRQEEAEAKQAEATEISGEVAAAEIDLGTPDNQQVRVFPALRLIPKTIRVPRKLLPYRQAQSRTPEARLTQWLENVRRASGEFQRSRRRDGVYIFLERVFEIVMHYKVRRRTNRLLRRAFKFAGLSFDPHVDPFAAIIRCTTGGDVDSKAISKYARALRYASRRKEPDMPLKEFMKGAGGLNACAARYAKQFSRSAR